MDALHRKNPQLKPGRQSTALTSTASTLPSTHTTETTSTATETTSTTTNTTCATTEMVPTKGGFFTSANVLSYTTTDYPAMNFEMISLTEVYVNRVLRRWAGECHVVLVVVGMCQVSVH